MFSPSDLVAVPKMILLEEIGCHDIGERFEQGAVTYADVLSSYDDNDWSHRFVKLAKLLQAVWWVHSSQIAS